MALIKELYEIQNDINALIEVIGTEEESNNFDDKFNTYKDTIESLEVVKEDLMNQLGNWKLSLEAQKDANKNRRDILAKRNRKIEDTLDFIETTAISILHDTKNQKLKTQDFDFGIRKTPGRLLHKGLTPGQFKKAVPQEFKKVVLREEIEVDNDRLKEFIKENGNTEYAQYRDENLKF